MKREFCSEPNIVSSREAAPGGARKYQQGVVLLLVMLVVLVGSTAILLERLHARAQSYGRAARSQVALQQAKQALIQYAVTYPEIYQGDARIPGPGYLPCPDHTDDGDGEDNCSDGAGVTGSTLGRLPTRDLGLDRLVDASGEQLWYAVSQSFKKHQLASHVLNSDSRGTLRVDEQNDIVAVVIAPGAPISSQTRRHGSAESAALVPGDTNYLAAVADQYLEDGNATHGDATYVTGSTVAHSSPQCTNGSLDDTQRELECFNDELITLTRRELMAAVEARVANDVRGALAAYRNASGGAFPWLAPFTDPKRGGRYSDDLGIKGYGVAGRHTGAAGITLLTDSNADFLRAGVVVGSLVWNTSDGSFGIITQVTATSLRVTALLGGEENDFDKGDNYYVDGAQVGAGFSGVAATGSGATPNPDCGCTILKAGADLEQAGVVPGDIMENTSNSVNASVISVDGDVVWVDSGSGAIFVPGQSWRVRSALGMASAGSATTLVDQYQDFQTAGVQAGYLVRNLTDGSRGIVTAVPDNQTLTMETLQGGTNNEFMNGDSYAVSPLQPVLNTRAGVLPVHEPGKPFATEFMVRWSLLEADGNTIVPADPGAPDPYQDGLRNWISSSLDYSDINHPAYPDASADSSYPDAVTANSALACTWVAVNVADCMGKFADTQFLTATVGSVSQVGAKYVITDRGTRFYAAGVAAGAKIRNLTQGLEGIVYLAAAGTSSPSDYSKNTVQAVAIADGNPPFSASVGDQIRIRVASKRLPATVTANGATNPGLNKVCRTGANFAGYVEPGDTIRLSGSGTPVGRIEVVAPGGEVDCVTYTDLLGGSATHIAKSNNFRIHYDFVQRREWQFNVRMSGTNGRENGGIGLIDPAPPPGRRLRSVCRGFGNDCASRYKGNLHSAENGPVISFADYESEAELGSASVTIPPGGAAEGSLMVGRMDYLMIAADGANGAPGGYAGDYTEAEMLPRWFLRNRWHEYIFLSYINALTPTAVAENPASDCVAGADCLQIKVHSSPSVIIKHDLKAVVMMAGAGLPAHGGLPAQNRVTGGFDQYFEGLNADAHTGDALFERGATEDAFNDHLGAVVPE